MTIPAEIFNKSAAIFAKALENKGWILSCNYQKKHVSDLYYKYHRRAGGAMSAGRFRLTLRLAAFRLSNKLEAAEAAVLRWNLSRVEKTEERAAMVEDLSEWSKRASVACRVLNRAKMPEKHRDAIACVLSGTGDAGLLRLYPKSTRNQRDQWRSRGRKKILQIDPSLNRVTTLWGRPSASIKPPRKPTETQLEMMNHARRALVSIDAAELKRRQNQYFAALENDPASLGYLFPAILADQNNRKN